MKRADILQEIINKFNLQDYQEEELKDIISSDIGIALGEDIYIVVDDVEQPIIATVIRLQHTEVDDRKLDLIQAVDSDGDARFFSPEDIGRILFTSVSDAENKIKELLENKV